MPSSARLTPTRRPATTGRANGDAAAGYGPGEEPRPPDGLPTATANHELL